MTAQDLGRLFEEHRVNAALAWLLVVLVGLTAVEEVLFGELLWAAFAVGVAALALVPPVAFRSPRVMLPWEVLLLAALPVIGRVFATNALSSALATYLAVAAVALIVAVELHVFTSVRMTVGFAILTVVVMTLAAAGVWAILRWISHIYLGTPFYEGPDDLDLLMWEFVYSTAAGLGAGVTFELYFRRRRQVARRALDAAEEVAHEGLTELAEEVADE
ncbi:hypothetical protein [Haloarchaeobius amylolyticus]|uniref:hypothetical protein n=1 Tax=Haloarchaeobius amylolyticus TaxID=1198296 RepID=UPI002270F145|nr:hypothetical protein [Haloarchaeobius amylolyticus]